MITKSNIPAKITVLKTVFFIKSHSCFIFFCGHFCFRKNRAFRTSAPLRSIPALHSGTPPAVLQSLVYLFCASKISQRARHAQIPCPFFTYKFFLFFCYNLLFPVFSLENAKSKIRKHLFFLTVCNNFIMTANCGII